MYRESSVRLRDKLILEGAVRKALIEPYIQTDTEKLTAELEKRDKQLAEKDRKLEEHLAEKDREL